MVKTLTSNQNYIECKDENGVLKFRVQGNGSVVVGDTLEVLDGFIDCKDIEISDGALLYGDAALGFIPFDANGNEIPNREFRFGRSKDIGDFSHEGDGLQFWGLIDKNGTDKNCAVQIGILPAEPSISVRGFKNSGEHYFEVKDEEGELIFAIGSDGHVFGSYVVDPSNAKDSYNSSSVHNSDSVYIGPARISYTGGKLRFYNIKNTIPTILAASPYNVSSIPAAVSGSADKIHEWMHLARTLASDNTVTVSSVFPAANLGADFDEIEYAETDDVYTKAEIDQDVATLETSIALKQDDLTDASHTHLHLHSGGTNVGIGTSTPTSRFHIHDSGGDHDLQISRDLADNHIKLNSNSFMITKNPASSVGYKFRVVTANPMSFETSNIQRLLIDKDGLVGIGNATPAYKLDIDGDCNLSSGSTYKINGTDFLGNVNNVGSYSTQQTDTLLSAKENTIGDGDLTIAKTSGLQASIDAKQDSLSDASHTHLHLHSAGTNVGVGTNNPTSRFHIHDSGGDHELQISRDVSDNNIKLNSNSFTISKNPASSVGYKFRLVSANPLSFETSNTERLRIDKDGLVGIGTATPGSLLDVNGIANFSTKVTTPLVESSSDLELKATSSDAIKFYTSGSERCKVTSAGNLQFGPGLGLNLTKSLGDAGNANPIIWDAATDTASVDFSGVRSGKIPYSIRYNVGAVTNTFSVTVDVGTTVLTVNSIVLWSVVHEDGHCAPYTWSRSFHFNYGTGIMKFVIGSGGTDDLSSNTGVSGSINYTIL
jgi:hypothetical protein